MLVKRPRYAGHPPSGAVRVALPVLHVRFRDRRPSMLAAAACALAVLIGLALMPVVFVIADHTLVVEWINAVFDLAGL
jgi:cyanate permease